MDNYVDFEPNRNLIEQLSECGTRHTIYAAPHQKITFQDKSQSYIYIIQHGIVDVRRKKDDIIVLTTKSPSVLGLTSLFSDVYYHYLSTVTEAQIIAINRLAAMEYLTSESLWQEAAKVLCQASQFYYQRDEVVSGNTVYDVIRNHLEILWRYPQGEREKISVFDFIMGRSNISRSSLNKVLKDLSLGGYLILQRGKLLDLRKLPKSY
ncbi:helix-turn-helix domain-containing protein [Lelliottia amnigena]|jgi:CRP-like cAMP-binding protein|uniref:helix-turn-helix domain-containing protein n=1 Tax=Lelliottia TaxID=1330545 RepID=UPI00192AEA82|nr:MULTISPECIES: helix-turn-helix domain-containing protein [Lelliottia]MBL5884889.1 helix-turn-helix domain-containing protein [Lelliottia aquatilis]MBL5923876.1 helix-turn-helix domain-containing protein [Lelliottia amnigena]MBL5932721.1 helix-turn-helix domain-containing protein [Lelliottia amnigena]